MSRRGRRRGIVFSDVPGPVFLAEGQIANIVGRGTLALSSIHAPTRQECDNPGIFFCPVRRERTRASEADLAFRAFARTGNPEALGPERPVRPWLWGS